MKIAFASCFDARSDKKQKVWNKVLNKSPDALLLLGDSIYMDFGISLNRPRKWKQQKFADKMYKRYAKQWKVSSFRSLIQSVSHIGLTWDDHDFGWNNCYSVGVGKKVVPKNKRLISQGLFKQFRKLLQKNSTSNSYPSQPLLADLLNKRDKSIEQVLDIGQVRIIMLDGRTFREKATEKAKNHLLGTAQRKWLKKRVNEWTGISIICTGSILSDGRESWDKYQDFDWLMAQKFTKTIVLSGDIHRNAYQEHSGNPKILEFTSSGAARSFGGKGNFGLLDVNGNTVTATLFDKKGIQFTRSVTF